ncbi:hypothetical protein V1478_007460 [Vespula squamosa]|uniref:Uncharacterized protein n=1 Tax=Vespula squamosa TaxID=30214 RepID=A0ABD2B366_VESSQ
MCTKRRDTGDYISIHNIPQAKQQQMAVATAAIATATETAVPANERETFISVRSSNETVRSLSFPRSKSYVAKFETGGQPTGGSSIDGPKHSVGRLPGKDEARGEAAKSRSSIVVIEGGGGGGREGGVGLRRSVKIVITRRPRRHTSVDLTPERSSRSRPRSDLETVTIFSIPL